jgi:hypothetical protein
MRGPGPTKAARKVLEVTVGENSYSLEVAATAEGSLDYDMAGVRTPVREPLSICVSSGAGEELISVRSDEFGNCHFVVPSGVSPGDLRVLTLTLKDDERQLLLRVPEEQKSL